MPPCLDRDAGLGDREPQCPEVRQALALEKVVRASRPLPGMQESRQQVPADGARRGLSRFSFTAIVPAMA